MAQFQFSRDDKALSYIIDVRISVIFSGHIYIVKTARLILSEHFVVAD